MNAFFKKVAFAVLVMGFAGALYAQSADPMDPQDVDEYTTTATMPNVAYDRITIHRRYRGIEATWLSYQAGWEMLLYKADARVLQKNYLSGDHIVYTVYLPEGHYLNQYIQAFPEGQREAAIARIRDVTSFVSSHRGHVIKQMLVKGNYRDFVIGVYYSGPGPLGKQVNAMFPAGR